MNWVLFVAVASPIAWLPGQYGFCTPKIAAVLVGLLYAGARPTRAGCLTVTDGLVAAGVAWAAVSSASAADTRIAWWGYKNDYAYGVLALAAYAAVYWAARRERAKTERLAVQAFAWTGAMIGLWAVIQYTLASSAGIWTQMLLDGRPVGTLGGPTYLGSVLAMALPCAWGNWVLVAPIVLGLGLAKSGGAWVAAVVGLICLRGVSIPAQWIAAAVLVAICAGLAFVQRGDPIMSMMGRLESWRGAVETSLRSPIVGVGPSSWAMVAKSQGPGHIHQHAHGDIPEALASAGFPGALVYMALWIVYGRRARGGEARACAVAYFAAAKFTPMAFEASAIAALMAGLSLRGELGWRMRST